MGKSLRAISFAVATLALFALQLAPAMAADGTNRYYFENVAGVNLDSGYTNEKPISEGDPHFGWRIGRFYVEGYTRDMIDSEGNPVFLKNTGDEVKLWFVLEQDIDALGGNESLTVSEDRNGYDEGFGIEKTNFGRGALLTRHIDYQNAAGQAQIYMNYFVEKCEQGADKEIGLFEEGDYEVALDYELRNDVRHVFGRSILPEYGNYRMHFKFSVRNGSSMVYLRDAKTESELTSSSSTENGFTVDMAKSRYLDVDVKREVMAKGSKGMVEDTRFNKPAKDGEQYTEEGIYIVTATNRYTNMQTSKVIYVGTNPLFKAHVVTGLAVEEIEKQVNQGAQIRDDGTIAPSQAASGEGASPPADEERRGFPVVPVAVVALATVVVVLALAKRRRGAADGAADPSLPEPDAEDPPDVGALPDSPGSEKADGVEEGESR